MAVSRDFVGSAADDARRRREANRLTALGLGLVLLLHVWIVTAGWMTWWPQYTSHYNRLAESFRRGQVSLLIRPAPEMLALPDPYDPAANEAYRYRPGVHDTVLFGGRLYLYWGPAPALLLMPVKAIVGRGVVGDQYLVFAFDAGLMLFTALLMRRVWGRFFFDRPPWLLLLAIVTAGLATPIPYTLARSAVYEAAILGGQCFLLAGIYAAFAGRGAPGKARLATASACWAMSAGSRVSLVFAIGALVLILVVRIAREARADGRRSAFARLAALGTPLALGAVLLGGYNVIRFGSWHEFGQRYQLGGANYRATPSLFQPANAVPGMYSYLLRPLQVHRQFPFVDAAPGTGRFPKFIHLPEHYECNEPIAGILLATPFIWLAFLPALGLLRPARDEEERALKRIVLALAGAGVLGFAPIPFMLGSTMRYLCDLTPCLMILAAVGLWQRARRSGGGPRRVFVAVAGCMSAWSIGIGLLLGVTGYFEHFRHYHRHLFGNISYWANDPEL